MSLILADRRLYVRHVEASLKADIGVLLKDSSYALEA
jgi:hypothetical protein